MTILIIYYQPYEYGLRKTIKEHLSSFRRYSSGECLYLNVAGGIPNYISEMHFDLVIYHYTICACRFQSGFFEKIDKKWHVLKSLSGYKAAMPQDEYVNTDGLCRFFSNFGVKTIFTCLPEHEWSKVYPREKSGVADFVTVFPGYVEEQSIPVVSSFRTKDRDIDVGYRARKNSYSLGHHATIKWRIAELFNSLTDRRGLRFDISTEPSDVFYGDDWYRFLCRCRTILGCEGGASLHDPDGSVERKVDAYLAGNPQASFKEVAQACFPGLDGQLSLFALSPRHFEACITKTCQVLVEGEYGGILKPGVHFIELKKDWSNLPEVLDKIADVEYCDNLAENAYRDIVLSGHYTYRAFVNAIIDHIRTQIGGGANMPAELGPYAARLRRREQFGRIFLIPSFFRCIARKPLRRAFEVMGCPEGYQQLKRLIVR